MIMRTDTVTGRVTMDIGPGQMQEVARRTRPVVYIIQEDPKKNTVGVLNYGSAEVLLTAYEEATMLNIRDVVAKIRYGLRHMRPIDYLVCIGNPVSIGVAFAVAAEFTGGRFKVLKWDNQEKRYWEASINL